jgi:hypothetical protein
MTTSRKTLLGLGALLAITLATAGALNRAGMCLSERRWLSDEEYLDRATRNSFDYWQKRAVAPVSNPNNLDIAVPNEYTKILQYKSVREFRAAHPDCCVIGGYFELTRGLEDREAVSFLGTLFGYGGKIVNVSYNTSATFKSGVKQIRVVNQVPMTNCGVEWLTTSAD